MNEEPVRRVGPYHWREARDGSWYYVEIGGNGETLNTSEMYTTEQHAREGAEAALRVAREEELPPD